MRLLAAASVVAAAVVAAFASAPAAAQSLAFVGSAELPTGLSLQGMEVGGLSGLDHDPATGRYVAISDDRAEIDPARFFTLALSVDEKRGLLVDLLAVTPITGPDGAAFAPKGLDAEAIRHAPGGGYYWAHERDAEGKPFAGRMDASGRTTAAFELPAYYMPAEGVGIRQNLGFESLTIGAGGVVILANEEALAQDGPTATLERGSLVRVLTIDPTSGKPMAEHLYPIDPIAARATTADGFQAAGLVELLWDEASVTLFALERSYSAGQGTVAKLYATSFEGATDVLGRASIAEGERPTPMTKRPVATFFPGETLRRVDNLEAMTFGPAIGEARTLVLMSDNNFSASQVTQILVYRLEP